MVTAETVRPKIVTIEPAKGEARTVLIEECAALISQKKFNPDSWRQFTSNMVYLLGGTENKRHEVGTLWLGDKDNNRNIRFFSLTKSDLFGEHLIVETRVIVEHKSPSSKETIETRRVYLPEKSVVRLCSKSTVTLATDPQLQKLAHEIFQTFTTNFPK